MFNVKGFSEQRKYFWLSRDMTRCVLYVSETKRTHPFCDSFCIRKIVTCIFRRSWRLGSWTVNSMQKVSCRTSWRRAPTTTSSKWRLRNCRRCRSASYRGCLSMEQRRRPHKELRQTTSTVTRHCSGEVLTVKTRRSAIRLTPQSTCPGPKTNTHTCFA